VKTKTRLTALSAATLLAAGTLITSATTASAASYSATCSLTDSAHKSITMRIYDSSIREVGQVEWNGDPNGSIPGDAMRAYDGRADGWGVEAHLSTGRIASTRGHEYGYWSTWATGDLPEDHDYAIEVWMWKDGGYSIARSKCKVSS
jgi:hypothetical protein